MRNGPQPNPIRQLRDAAYFQPRGKYEPFEFIGLSPKRSASTFKRVCQDFVTRELTDQYLNNSLSTLFPGSPAVVSSIETIKRIALSGLISIIQEKIRNKRRGSRRDKNLFSLKSSITNLQKSILRLEKAELKAIASSIQRDYGFNSARIPMIMLNNAAEVLDTKEMNKERPPMTLTTNEDLKLESQKEHLHPTEEWSEAFLRLLRAAQRWIDNVEPKVTARSSVGQPRNEALKTVALDLYDVYRSLECSVETHKRFAHFLTAIMGPLIPSEHQPRGGFNSLARDTRKAL